MKIILLAVLLIGAAIRIAALWGPVSLIGDAGSRYNPLALNLIAGNGFSSELQPPYTVNDFDQPGYPGFVAAVYWLGSPRMLAAVQLLLELSILWCVWIIAGRFSRRTQIVAVSIGWLCPFLPLFANRVLTEVLATALVTGMLAALLEARERSWLWGLAGCLGGLCLLVRPDLLIAVVLMWGATFALRPKRAALLFPVVVVLILIPWTVRNYVTFGAVRPLGRVTEQTQYAYVRWLNTWLDDPKYIHSYFWQPVNRLSDGEYLEMAERAKDARPIHTAVIVPIKRMIMTWVRLPTYIQWRAGKIAAYVFWLGLLVMAGLGVGRAIYQKHWVLLIPLSLIVARAVLPLVTAIGAEPRYIIETLPVLFLFAGLLTERGSVTLAHSHI